MTPQCPNCEQTLGEAQYAFALQAQQVEYTQPGETPDQQAVLTTLGLKTLGRYCSKACCKKQLPERLEQLGLPSEVQHHHVGGGPIWPCGHCGKPVNLTKPHISVIRGDVAGQPNDGESYPDVQTMHTVLCKGCLGTQAQELMAFVRDHLKKVKTAQRREQRAIEREQALAQAEWARIKAG